MCRAVSWGLGTAGGKRDLTVLELQWTQPRGMGGGEEGPRKDKARVGRRCECSVRGGLG